MKDLTEKLWPAFLAEVTEHLDALELALVGRAANDIADINAVFRSFHTIKGGCAMMGFGNMEAVAHASEDLLDPLRKGQRPLTDALVTLLLEVIDCLKAQLAEAARTRTQPAAAPALLERLHAARDGVPMQGAAEPAGAAAPALPSSLPSATPSADDNHALDAVAVAAFAETARNSLPAITAAVLADKALSAASKRELVRVADAARTAGITAIASLLDRVTAAQEAPARLALFANIVDRIAWLESAHSVDGGSSAIGSTARAQLEPPFRSGLQALQSQIDELAGANAGSPALRNVAVQAAATAEPFIAHALLLRLDGTAALLRQVAQVLREIARGGIAPDGELAELLAIACPLAGELDAGLVEDSGYRAMCAQLRESMQRAAQRLLHGKDSESSAVRIRQRIDISPELLDALAGDALAALETAINRDETIVEIEADLEATPDFGQEFVAWLSRSGTLISNHTVFHRETTAGKLSETTRLRFLAALRLSLEEARLVLGELDPQRRYFDLRHCARLDATADTAAATRPAKEAQAVGSGNATGAATLRIDSSALDRFVDRVGEMVMLRNMLSHTLHSDDMATRLRRARTLLAGKSLGEGDAGWLRALLADIEAQQEQLSQTDVRMLGALGRMQEDVLALRVVPIGMVFNRLPRVVRDISHSQGKTVDLDLRGEDVRIDKGMVDLLIEPLMHMVRNAIDHGIETAAERERAGKPATATLLLGARQQGNTLLIEIADDGRGLDVERIRAKAVASGLLGSAEAAGLGERDIANLIFLPGFSTAERVTEVSGRGVGMDVVKTRIAQVGGLIDVRSTAGQGVTFTLKLPLSVAIQSVVHVTAGERHLAIPDRSVLEIIALPASSLQSVQGQAACLLRGMTLPVYNLAALLGDDSSCGSNGTLEILVLSDGIHRIGLQVDRVVGRPEVFIRDIHPDIARIPGVGGAAVLGDGRVVIILDCENLFELALRRAQSLRTLLRAS